MKKILLLLFGSLLFASEPIEELINAYKEKKYDEVCTKGLKYFKKIRKDENLLTMYAFSCLYDDRINRLYVPTMILGKTPQSRHNRAYFSLIIAQKNILLSSFFDHEEYSGLNVPNTDYVLSRVFNLYFQKKYEKKGNTYLMEDSYGKYKVFVQYEKGKKWLVVEEIKDGKTIIHKYR